MLDHLTQLRADHVVLEIIHHAADIGLHDAKQRLVIDDGTQGRATKRGANDALTADALVEIDTIKDLRKQSEVLGIMHLAEQVHRKRETVQVGGVDIGPSQGKVQPLTLVISLGKVVEALEGAGVELRLLQAEGDVLKHLLVCPKKKVNQDQSKVYTHAKSTSNGTARYR